MTSTESYASSSWNSCRVLSILALSVLLAACGPEKETVSLTIGTESFEVEVARTREEQQEGLMNRKRLAENAGMIFVYERDEPHSFWMKDTLIPLSIAFLAKDGRIREIQDAKPLSQKAIRSTYSCRFVLEVNQGTFERLGVGVGDYIGLPDGFH